jgi:hypothetical protein
MGYYIITLKSKAVCKDFNTVSAQANQLIQFICSNISLHSKVILCHHELPINFIPSKNCITIDCNDIPLPKNKVEMMNDKKNKLVRAYKCIHDLGGGVCMQVDYDDLISKKLIDFIETKVHHPKKAYFFQNGYVWPNNTSFLFKRREFYKLCGTSFIVYWQLTDLITIQKDTLPIACNVGHHEMYDFLKKNHFDVSLVKSPWVIYRTDSEENWSQIKWKGWYGWRRFLQNFFSIRFLSKPLKHEFGKFKG